MEKVAVSFYERLGDALDAAGLTQKQLRERINADKSGPPVSAGSVSNWCNGVGALPTCKALNVTPDYLLGYTDVPNYSVVDAEILKQAEAYAHLTPQALNALHYDAVGPFLPPSATDMAALDGFGNMGEHREADAISMLLAQTDFLRALKTIADLQQMKESLASLDTLPTTAETEVYHFSLERDYEYLRFKVIDALTQSLDAIL